MSGRYIGVDKIRQRLACGTPSPTTPRKLAALELTAEEPEEHIAPARISEIGVTKPS